MGIRADYDPQDFKKPSLEGGGYEAVWRQETSRKFHHLMDAAMMVSFHKYGAVAKAYPENVNAIQSLMVRLDRYLNGDDAMGIEAGNAEYLVDVANFAMIEFMHPSIPAHFKATDSSGSPGRVWSKDGRETQDTNSDIEVVSNG